jgi:hypothetical protein
MSQFRGWEAEVYTTWFASALKRIKPLRDGESQPLTSMVVTLSDGSRNVTAPIELLHSNLSPSLTLYRPTLPDRLTDPMEDQAPTPREDC